VRPFGIAGICILAAASLALCAGAGQAQDATERTFWNLVKGSNNPAHLKSYLDTYPNGAFAEEARARLRELETAQAAPPRPEAKSAPVPPLAPQGGSGSALTSPAVIREVQERLYNLNYEIGVFSGRLDADTRTAIRQWQANTQRQVTGDLTSEELEALRNARLPTTWGALAYAARGASSVVWNRPSRQEASSAALLDCRKRSQGTVCKVVTAAETACGALGFYTGRVRSTTYWGAYAIIRPTLGQATDAALAECRQNAKRPEACGIRLAFCADGSHKR